MLRVDRRLLHNVDWPLLGAAFAIILLGILSLSSVGFGRGGSGLASSSIARPRGVLGTPSDRWPSNRGVAARRRIEHGQPPGCDAAAPIELVVGRS